MLGNRSTAFPTDVVFLRILPFAAARRCRMRASLRAFGPPAVVPAEAGGHIAGRLKASSAEKEPRRQSGQLVTACYSAWRKRGPYLSLYSKSRGVIDVSVGSADDLGACIWLSRIDLSMPPRL